MKSARKQLGKYVLPVVVIAQLFVIIGMMATPKKFLCVRNPENGALMCMERS